MSRKNSLLIRAERVAIEPVASGVAAFLSVRISNPTDVDLIRLIDEASALLRWRSRRDTQVNEIERRIENDDPQTP